MRAKQYRYLGVLLLLALMIRLFIAPWGGHVYDLISFAEWSGALSQFGFTQVYANSSANYPPLTMFLQWLSQTLFEMLSPSNVPNSLDPLWLVCLKLPAIFADLMMIVMAWKLAVQHDILDKLATRLLLLSIALNPVLIFMSAHWAQYDSVYAALLFAAFTSAQAGRNLRAGLWFGASLLAKQQSIFFVPPIAIAVLSIALQMHPDWAMRLRSLLLFAVGASIVVIAGFVPFALTNQVNFVLQRMVAIVTGQASLISWNATNFWFFFTVGEGNFGSSAGLDDSITTIAGVTFRQIGMMLLISWTVLVSLFAWYARRWRQTWMLAAALMALGIFLWPTQAHERYGVSAVPLIAGAALLAMADASDGGPREAAKGLEVRPIYAKLEVLYASILIGTLLNLLWAVPSSEFTWAMTINPTIYKLLDIPGTNTLPMIISVFLMGCAQWGLMLLPKPSTEAPLSANSG